MELPDRITRTWMDTLPDDALLSIEQRLRDVFFTLEREQKARLGDRYSIMHAPTEVLTAWDRWTRVSTATRARGLHPHYKR